MAQSGRGLTQRNGLRETTIEHRCALRIHSSWAAPFVLFYLTPELANRQLTAVLSRTYRGQRPNGRSLSSAA
jgi:hypothetical protein